MEAMPPKSTRCWPRYQVNLPVRMLVRKPGMLRLAYVRAQELNAGGMAVCAIVGAVPPADQLASQGPKPS